jgi:AraC-like DNA-binding protein
MLNEPTTLASVARLIWQTLEAEYGIDPAPLFADLNIDVDKFHKPGARVTSAKMDELWRQAVEISGAEEFGVKVGERLAPGDLFVLGHAWLASETLLDAFQRLCRFFSVLTSPDQPMQVLKHEKGYALVEFGASQMTRPPQASADAGSVAFQRMCDFVTASKVRPLTVNLPHARSGSSVNYADLFGCPVSFVGDDEILVFSAADLEAPLTGSIPDVADATDRIAASYIDSLVEGAIAHEVREMLLQLLPSGHVDQDTIAEKLYRSRSTLQRQLVAEGTSYRSILDSTRKNLAEIYLKNGEHTQAQIAFMVGFSDQSNFSRAFKRWTGVSPGEFQKI